MVKKVKHWYLECVGSNIHLNNSSSLWHGLHTITDYKGINTTVPSVNSTVTDVLNVFYARFEANSPSSSHLAHDSNSLLIDSDDNSE